MLTCTHRMQLQHASLQGLHSAHNSVFPGVNAGLRYCSTLNYPAVVSPTRPNTVGHFHMHVHVHVCWARALPESAVHVDRDVPLHRALAGHGPSLGKPAAAAWARALMHPLALSPRSAPVGYPSLTG